MDTINEPRPQPTTPNDFRGFWRKTFAELAAFESDVETKDFAHQLYPQLKGQKLRFSSLGGVRVAGYALGWRDDSPRPLVIHAHGYGGRVGVQWLWALSGFNIVGFDVRGFGQSFEAVPDRSPWGYVLTGIESPRDYVLRGAVCDYFRACQVGARLFEGRTRRIVYHGFSFSAALALMSEAFNRSASLLAAGVPTFGWHEGRLRLVKHGSAAEVRRYLRARPADHDRVMRTLTYFDSMNFAPLIQCPTLAGYGRRDDVVPPETVIAILDQLKCRRETMSLPVSHTNEPAEAAWERFDAAWMEMAQRGVPQAFGKEPDVQHIEFRER